jgi:hypothetical protein
MFFSLSDLSDISLLGFSSVVLCVSVEQCLAPLGQVAIPKFPSPLTRNKSGLVSPVFQTSMVRRFEKHVSVWNPGRAPVWWFFVVQSIKRGCRKNQLAYFSWTSVDFRHRLQAPRENMRKPILALFNSFKEDVLMLSEWKHISISQH